MSLSTGTATARALNTAELVEHILLHQLSPSTIFACRLTSHFFNAVILGSKKLSLARALGNKNILNKILSHLASPTEIVQLRKLHPDFRAVIDESHSLRQILHLDPVRPAEYIKIVYETNDGSDGSDNPYAPHTYVYSRDMVQYDPLQDIVLVRVHPALDVLETPSVGTTTFLRNFSVTIDPDVIFSWRRSNGEQRSWENIWITQPEVESFRVECDSDWHCRCKTRDVRGGTFGALRDEVFRRKGCDGSKRVFFQGYRVSDDYGFDDAKDVYWFAKEEQKRLRMGEDSE